MKQKDLSTLNLLELLEVASLIEEEAAERFGVFAEQMEVHHNEEAAQLFRELQSHELAHLERLRKQRTQRSDLPTSVKPLDLLDSVEATPYENVHYKMTSREIFYDALTAEKNAVDFYETLIKVLKDTEAKDLAQVFLEEEKRHVVVLEQKLEALSACTSCCEQDDDAPVPQA